MQAAFARRTALPPNCFLAINVSPQLLLEAPVRDVLEAAAPLHGIVIELTEHHAVEDSDALTDVLEWLRGAGAHLALDDVGAGYAGLQWLLKFRPHFLKLDIALVRDIDHDEAKRTLVEMVGALANRLDIWVLAEGVERIGELDALVSLGVPLAQGFGLARPASEFAGLSDDLTARLRRPPLDTTHGGAPATIIDLIERGSNVLPDAALLGTAQPRMRARETDTIAEVARRVLTRPVSRRWGPIDCYDINGFPLGSVRVERILDALTTDSERNSNS
jgi:EAL domain-containing protein (putative c-di-GMP-specific phosphodiesterase class I)